MTKQEIIKSTIHDLSVLINNLIEVSVLYKAELAINLAPRQLEVYTKLQTTLFGFIKEREGLQLELIECND